MPAGESFSPGSRELTRAGSGTGGSSRSYRAGRRERARTLCSPALHRTRSVDVVLAADEKRSALMQLGRLDVEDALHAVGGGAAGLLDDERQRIRFVKQPELSTLV